MRKKSPITKRTLSLGEQHDLKQLKQTITAGTRVFHSVLVSLAEIYERRLWVDEAHSFKEFCEKNWGWGESYIKRMMSAIRVRAGQKLIAETTGEYAPIPTTEGAARRISTVHVKKTNISNVTGPPTDTSTTEESTPLITTKSSKSKAIIYLDALGYPIPKRCEEFWLSRAPDAWIKRFRDLRGDLVTLMESKQAPYWKLPWNDVMNHMDDLVRFFTWSKPYVVCPTCAGQVPNGTCKTCNAVGMIPKPMWESPQITIQQRKARMREIEELQKQ